jgi:hypothetical protein
MNKRTFSIGGKGHYAVILVAAVLGSGSLAFAGTKPSAPSKPASAPRPAATPKPAGGGAAPHGAAGGAAASHGATGAPAGHTGATAGGASHGPTANGSHATTTTGGARANTTAGGAGAHGATTAGAAGAHGATPAGGAGAHGTATAAGGARGVSPAGGGARTVATPRGTTASKAGFKSATPKGASEHATRDGSAVRTRPNGRVSDVHDAKRGMDIHHGLNGGRRVSVERHDGSRLVAEHGRRGYVERGYHYHDHDFARRSYYYHGRAYDRYYNHYYYGGVYMNVYAPGFYFAPAFYGWAYNPWAVPIAYGWGWGGNPWYGFYGGYFTPYPSYAAANFWLTDYIISQDLQAAYAARKEAQLEDAGVVASGGPPVMTPEVKQMIADEVKAQLALENSEQAQNAAQKDIDPGSSGIARLIADGHPHAFVVGGSLDVTDSSGAECALSDGDALELTTPPAADATAADLTVLASKGPKECQRTSVVSVNLSDLQEMQNHLRETIDQGLQELQAKQGKGGLPPAPPSAQAPTAPAQYAAVAPPPNPQDVTDIQAQDQQANQAETEVASAASQNNSSEADPGAGATAPAPTATTVSLGQSQDDVKAAMGAPTKVANLGSKTIYYYNGMKVTFKDGKVSDVD